MKRLPVFIILSLLVFMGCRKANPDSVTAPEIQPGIYDSVIAIDGLPRTFRFYVPAVFFIQNQPSLTLVLHGMTQTGLDILGTILINAGGQADKTNSIIVCPTALYGHWNDKMGGVFPATDTIDDVQFLTSLIDFFIHGYHCNPEKIYLMGFSNGGMMAYRMGCDVAEKISAIAPFISMMGEEASFQTANHPPIPVFITNGTADPVMPWNGGVAATETVPRIGVLLSNDDNIAYWVKRNATFPAPDITYVADYCPGDGCQVIRYHYQGEHDIVFNKVVNGGHFSPVLSETPIVPSYNCDYNSVLSAWLFLHGH